MRRWQFVSKICGGQRREGKSLQRRYQVMEKHWDPSAGQFYYLNSLTGAVTWTKPSQLGKIEIEDPPDEWVEMVDEYGGKYYYHALTGRTSWLSEEEAATLLQRLYRKKQAGEFAITDMMQIVRALKFINTAEESYANRPNALPSIINYALLMHTQHFDYKTAKQITKKHMRLLHIIRCF